MGWNRLKEQILTFWVGSNRSIAVHGIGPDPPFYAQRAAAVESFISNVFQGQQASTIMLNFYRFYPQVTVYVVGEQVGQLGFACQEG